MKWNDEIYVLPCLSLQVVQNTLSILLLIRKFQFHTFASKFDIVSKFEQLIFYGLCATNNVRIHMKQISIYPELQTNFDDVLFGLIQLRTVDATVVNCRKLFGHDNK